MPHRWTHPLALRIPHPESFTSSQEKRRWLEIYLSHIHCSAHSYTKYTVMTTIALLCSSAALFLSLLDRRRP